MSPLLVHNSLPLLSLEGGIQPTVLHKHLITLFPLKNFRVYLKLI